MRSLVKNAGNEKQVRYAKKREQRQIQQERELLRDQLSTPRGREREWALLEQFGIFDTHDGPMEYVYAMNAVANVGRRHYARLMADHPEAFLLMQQEALLRSRQQDRDVEQAQADTEDPE